MKKKDSRFYALSIIVLLIIVLFTIYISNKIIGFINDPLLFRAWVADRGLLGPVVYILLIIIQILFCFIPGEPFELAGGYAFGPIKGTIYCLIAESIGSIIVILLTKKYGKKLVYLFFEKEKIDSLKFLKSSPSKISIFSIIFILPGTPKDLLCYVSGLTDIDQTILFFITTLGRFPSIITSILGANALGNKNYLLAIIIFGITIIISLIGIYVYNRIIKNACSSSAHIQDK